MENWGSKEEKWFTQSNKENEKQGLWDRFLTGRWVGLFWHYSCGNSNIPMFKQVCKYNKGQKISGAIWGKMPSNPTGKTYSRLMNVGSS